MTQNLPVEAERNWESEVKKYLALPYSWVVIPESDGSFRGEVQEFPGCIAVGDSPSETLEALQHVAESWIQAMLSSGQDIPDPAEKVDYSGKLMLRLPKSLHKKASLAAERDGVSLNQFVITCLAEGMGKRSTPPVNNITAQILLMAPNTMAPQIPVSIQEFATSNVVGQPWPVNFLSFSTARGLKDA